MRQTILRRKRLHITHLLASATIILSCTLFMVAALRAADDIFAAPVKPIAGSNPYPTPKEFLAATRSGVIPEMFREGKYDVGGYGDDFANSLTNIVEYYYGLDDREQFENGHIHKGDLVNMVALLTEHELNDHSRDFADAFRREQDSVFGSPDNPSHHNQYIPAQEAFHKFALEYSQAVKEYAATKQKADEQRQELLVEKQRENEAASIRAAQETRKLADEQRQKKELDDARIASLKAADDIKVKAAQDSTERQNAIRKQKLKDTLASPAYKLWEVSLQIQQGEEMILNAQKVLDHEDAVQKESGVVNLSARRSAGEQTVAGKELVGPAFETYKKLGGKATDPREVVPGPDPAAEYR